MSETTYKLPGLEVAIEGNGLGLGNDVTGSNNVLIIGFTDDNTMTERILEPTHIKLSTDFDGSNALGSYSTDNSLATGFKQMIDICKKGVYAIPVSANLKIAEEIAEVDVEEIKKNNPQKTEENETNEAYEERIAGLVKAAEEAAKEAAKKAAEDKKVEMIYYLQDLLFTLKDNSMFSDIVLKNIYNDDYELKDGTICVSLDFLQSVVKGTSTVNDAIKDKWLYIVPGKTKAVESVKIGTETISNYSFVKLTVEDKNVVLANSHISNVSDEILYAFKGEGIFGYDGTYGEDIAKFTHSISLKSMLANFCITTTLQSSQILGYMSERPIYTRSMVEFTKWVKELPSDTYNGYLQVCATPLAMFTLNGASYVDTIEAAYCGLVASLEPESSTTNKEIPGLVSMVSNLSANQSSAIASKNYVTIRQKSGRYTIADGVTMAGKSSDFTRLTTVRITNQVVDSIRIVADPYIGEPNTLEKRNALRDQCEEVLDLLRQDGVIQAYKLELLALTQDIIDGNLKIALSIVPAFEIRRINLVISLKPSL